MQPQSPWAHGFGPTYAKVFRGVSTLSQCMSLIRAKFNWKMPPSNPPCTHIWVPTRLQKCLVTGPINLPHVITSYTNKVRLPTWYYCTFWIDTHTLTMCLTALVYLLQRFCVSDGDLDKPIIYYSTTISHILQIKFHHFTTCGVVPRILHKFSRLINNKF